MNSFRVGEKVRCIKGYSSISNSHVVKSGKTYYIVHINEYGHLKIRGDDWSWDKYRFDKVSKNNRGL